MVDVVDNVSGMVDFGSDAAPDFFFQSSNSGAPTR